MSLSFHNLSHSYGQTQVLQDISLTAIEGEILCLLGPSGGGKSTLLRLAAGLEPLQQGHIDLNGALLAKPGAEPPAEDRPIGLVFQDYVLFPHLSVAQNVAFGLARKDAKSHSERVTGLLERMDLEGLGERFPHELSGGQQQRVALARALAPEPAVLLLDEPFASVDSTLRRSLRQATRRTLKEAGTTAIVVTHDPEEAMQLADSIAIMADGRIAQHAAPETIWNSPATLDVALLFGDAQAVAGESLAGEVTCGFARLPSTCPDGPVTVAVRPQAVVLQPSNNTAPANVEVADMRLLGRSWQAQLRALGASQDSEPQTWVALVDAANSVNIGARVHATLDQKDCFIFSDIK